MPKSEPRKVPKGAKLVEACDRLAIKLMRIDGWKQADPVPGRLPFMYNGNSRAYAAWNKAREAYQHITGADPGMTLVRLRARHPLFYSQKDREVDK